MGGPQFFQSNGENPRCPTVLPQDDGRLQVKGLANLRENGSATSPRNVAGSRSEQFQTPAPRFLDGALYLAIYPAGPMATPGLPHGTTCEGASEGQRDPMTIVKGGAQREGRQAHLHP